MKTEFLGSLIEECTERNRKLVCTEVFSVTNSAGFVKSTDFFDKEVFSKDISTYKLVSPGQFAYNPSRINVGSVDYLKKSEPVVVSPLYIVFKCKSDLSEEYLKRFLKSQLGVKRIRSKTKGAVRDILSFKSLCEIKMPLPSIEEQKQVTNLLKKVDILLSQRQETIGLVDLFLKSTFLHMFEKLLAGKKTNLSEVATVVSGLTKGKKYEGKRTSYLPYMRVANVQDGFLDLNEIKEIEATTDEVEKYELKDGDLLLTEGGDPDKLGRGAVWKGEIEKCIYQNHIFRVRADTKIIDPIFLSFLTGSSYGKRYFLKAAKQTTGIASINSSQLKSFPVIVPPLQSQKQFARIVGRAEALKLQYKTSLIELRNLYVSLSQKAFKGELQVKSDAKVVSLHIDEKEQDYFKKRKALACYIINQSLDDDKFGDTKFEKLLNLSDQYAIQRNLGQTYYQKVAGPYDNEFTKLFYIQIAAEKLYKRKRSAKQSVFIPDINHKKTFTAVSYFSNDELSRVDKLITYFKKYTYEQPEIISTLYAVWNNRIIRQQQITDEILKQDFLDWDEKKRKYKNRLDAALAWMKKENIIPNGWGKLIEKPKGKQRKLVVGKKRTNSKRAS